MKPACDLASYLSAPYGRYVAGPTYLHFFAHPGLCGTLLWGRPDAQDMRAFTRILEVELPERSGPHAALVDARQLTGVDPMAFITLARHVGPLAQRFGGNVTRQAIVRPPGVVGAVVSGFYAVTPAAHPERTHLFDDLRDATRWLGCCPDGLVEELAEALEAVTGRPPVVRALGDYVLAHLDRVSIKEVARALGLSTRTLQQQLRAANTTFRREVSAGRVRAAQRLLETSSLPVSEVALEVGCGTLQHFSTLFRKHTGKTPSAWRAENAPGQQPAAVVKPVAPASLSHFRTSADTGRSLTNPPRERARRRAARGSPGRDVRPERRD